MTATGRSDVRPFDLALLSAFDALMEERSATRAAARLETGQAGSVGGRSCDGTVRCTGGRGAYRFAIMSISTIPPRASPVTPTVVRAGSRSGGK